MSLKIQIEGGTSLDGNLCDTCKYQRKVTYQNGKSSVFCSALNSSEGPYHLKGDVAECNIFEPKGQLNIWEIKEMAWLIEVRNRKIGFVSPLKRTEKQEKEVESL